MAAEDGIKATSITLMELLRDRMARVGVTITFGPPKVGPPDGRVNLFLFQVSENPFLRNEEDPRRAVFGDYGSPPLALTLGYLMTSYGQAGLERPEGENVPADSIAELDAQWLLADAMRVFHDAPIVTRATPRDRPLLGKQLIMEPELRAEFESLRITPRSLTLDDISKMWTAFKDEFQRAVAYDVSIVRIEAPRQQVAGAPVLARGAAALPSAAGPTLDRLDPQSAIANQIVSLFGSNLDGAVNVLISDANGTGFPPPKTVLPLALVAGQPPTFAIPNTPALFMPGPKLIEVPVPQSAGHLFTSTPALLALVPAITGFNVGHARFDGSQVQINGTLLGHAFDATMPTSPLLPTVMFGPYVIPAADVDTTNAPNQLVVALNPVPAGTTPQPPSPGLVSVRVRVNGVESRTWRINAVTKLPELDPAVKFTVDP